MVASVLALSLFGLSAVHALPSNLQDRQDWIIGGPSNGAITPGDPSGGMPTCNPDVPPEQQEACLYPPITGEFKPSPKRQLINPSNANIKEAIKTLELELIRLQNKNTKTKADTKAITIIKAELKRLAGVVNVQAPPGTSVTLTPGKRDTITLDGFGDYKSQCPSTKGLQQALSILLSKPHHSDEETLAIVQLTHILGGCGASISDEGATFTKITPKRDTSSDVSVAGLQIAYTDGLAALGDHKPSFTSWLILEGIADTLEANGVTVDRSVVLGGSSSASLIPRQQRIGTCDPIDVLLLMTLYRSILREYGRDTSKWPNSVTSQARSILTVLSLCGEPTSTITPVPMIPGGSIIPNPTIPGGSIEPVPTIPGGSIEPVPTIPGGSLKPTKRSIGSALEALEVLEKAYGSFKSGKIPPAVYLPMASLVAYLQGQGVVVLGWPTTTIGVAP